MFHLTFVLLTGSFVPPAYLDPGSVSFIIHMLIAAALGIGVAIAASWSKIKRLFGVKPKTDEAETDDEDVDENAVK